MANGWKLYFANCFAFLRMQSATDNRKRYYRFAMMSLPVEEPPSKTGVRLRIKYNKTTIVLNILVSVLLNK